MRRVIASAMRNHETRVEVGTWASGRDGRASRNLLTADRENVRRLRQEANTSLEEAHACLVAWAGEARKWEGFDAESGEADEFAAEVADVLRRQAGAAALEP